MASVERSIEGCKQAPVDAPNVDRGLFHFVGDGDEVGGAKGKSVRVFRAG